MEHIKTQKTNVNTSVYSEVNEKTKQALSTLKAGDQLQIKWSFGWFHENSVQAGKLIQSEKSNNIIIIHTPMTRIRSKIVYIDL